MVLEEAGYVLGQTVNSCNIYSNPGVIVNRGEGYENYTYADAVTVTDAGVVDLVDATTVSIAYNPSLMASTFRGKFLKYSGVTYYVPDDAEFTTGNTSSSGYAIYNVYLSGAKRVDGFPAGTYTDYVMSPDADAYISGDKVTYEYLGQMSEKVRVAVGSYTGTGGTGSGSPCVLTFEFEPKIVFVQCIGTTYLLYRLIMQRGTTHTAPGDHTNDVVLTWSGNTLSWYSNHIASQNSAAGTKYAYIAFG